MIRQLRLPFAVLLALVLFPAIPGSPIAPQVADAATTIFSGGSVALSRFGGSPYPSTIDVAGVPGTVVHVNVTLTGLRYSGPSGERGSCGWSQLDMLLVGPDGRSSILMSDVPRNGNGQDSVRNLVIDDFAGPDFPNTGTYSDGAYQPTDYEPGDAFPSPAPAGPHPANLDVFIGGPASGVWSLFIVSENTEFGKCSGGISGWTLQISDGATFSNRNTIRIPDSGTAFPYPATIDVSGMPGKVQRVTVQLNGVNHEGLPDVDILLVSPEGIAALVLSDAGGPADTDDPFAMIGIADAAQRAMGQNSVTQSGWFQSRNWPGGDDVFPAPAPPTPAGVGLFPVIGAEPNGTWSLYVIDDSPTRSGVIADGWSLNVEVDAIPPVTTSTLNPPPNDAGWIDTNTVLTLAATDPGGSGVRTMTYSATGALTFAERSAATANVDLNVTPEGITTFRFFATDVAGIDEPTRQRVVRVDRTAPSVTPPVQLLAPNIGTGGVNVRLTWSGADATSGIARYILEKSVDGEAFTAVTLPAARAPGTTLTLLPGTYQFRTRAIDRAGHMSPFATGPTFQVVAAGENRLCSPSVTTNCLTYTGTWTQETLADAHVGGVRSNSNSGSTARFTFTGNRVSWTTMKGPNRGIARVSIDGAFVTTVDLFAASNTRAVAYINNALSNGPHTLVIRVTGTRNPESSGTSVAIDVMSVLN